MLQVSKAVKGGVKHYLISGSVGEHADLAKLLGPPAPKMDIHLKNLKTINSLGVKRWVLYFRDAADKGAKLTFHECPPLIVEQVNLIADFFAGGTVESIFVPYSCSKCRAELNVLFKTRDIVERNYELPTKKCPKCGGDASMDEVPEQYFAFLMR